MKKILSLLVLFFITVSFTFSQTYGKKQLIPANHWIYDAIYTLSFEYNWADKIRGLYCAGIEAIYTSPYLYYKSGADWSLYRARYNESRKSNAPICSTNSLSADFSYVFNQYFSVSGNFTYNII